MRSTAFVALCALALALTARAAVGVDPALPAYKATSGISGNLKSIGSGDGIQVCPVADLEEAFVQAHLQ